MTKEDAKEKIAKTFEEGQTSYQVMITIPGKFLLANNIQQEWAEARGIDPKLINYEFEDNITLLQAKLLGVLDFANEGRKKAEYRSKEEETLTGEEDEPQGEYKAGK